MIAANGTDSHTMRVTRVAKAAGPCANQGRRSKGSNPRSVGTAVATPNSEWNSHWKTVVAAMTGIAQAGTSTLRTAVRPNRPSRSIISVTSVDSTMISTTSIAMNRKEELAQASPFTSGGQDLTT